MCLLRRFRPHMWWCLRRQSHCLVPATALWHASDGCIFGACDTAEARGVGRAAPHDTLCPVAPHAPTRLSVLLWPPLSQQQRPSPAVLIASTPRSHAWSSRCTMFISDSDLLLPWNFGTLFFQWIPTNLSSLLDESPPVTAYRDRIANIQNRSKSPRRPRQEIVCEVSLQIC